MILKQKDAIKAIKPTKGVNILFKMRTGIYDEMEKLQLLCIPDKESITITGNGISVNGDTVTESIVS